LEYKKVNVQKSHEVVLEHIKKQIISGQLTLGQKLPSVVDFAELFGVGRSTIREALSALKAMGWLDIQHGGGTYVSATLPLQTDDDDLFQKAESIQELLQIRIILETGSAGLAAKNRTSDDLRQLQAIIDQMLSHVSDEVASEQADVDFHVMIAKSTHNSLIIQLMESLSSKIHSMMRDTRKLWFFSSQSSSLRLIEEHQNIYQHILDQNEASAIDIMRQHIEKVERILSKVPTLPNTHP
jgi:GntR family transcriptional repressor for pyruvate dehydrogenase complex